MSEHADNIWARFEHDPRTPANGPLRASDRDRDVVNDALATAYSEGRLNDQEFDERSDAVARALTLAELPPLLADLIAPTLTGLSSGRFRTEAERRYQEAKRQALVAFLMPTIITWVIWSSLLLGGSGTAFPWPIFVTLGTAVRLVQLSIAPEDSIASIESDLEKRERRRIARERRRGLPPGQE